MSRNRQIAIAFGLLGTLGACSHLDDIDEPDGDSFAPDTAVDAGVRDAGFAPDAAGDTGVRDAGFAPDAGARDAGTNVGTMRYTFPAEGVVYDTATRLTWQRNLIAQKNGCAARSSCLWYEAATFCKDLVIGTYSNWRLPDAPELLGIVLLGVTPTIDAVAFPGTPPTSFWSSTLSSTAPGTHSVAVSFADGSSYDHVGGLEVRCVTQ
jgi:hypothetical protein